MEQNTIRFENVAVRFHAGGKDVSALEDVSLSLKEGSFTSIVGPSGCGKTTLLRLCAGLESATSGQTICHDEVVSKINTEVGFITQESNLFPWMTLYQNVEFPLKLRGVAPAERRERIQTQIEMVGLGGFENHYPHQLSGGMQKRASIIRTMVYEPDIILMDEPFGPLDAQTKMQLQDDLLRLWGLKNQTIMFVTHDLAEAVTLSDEVVVMSGRPGRIKGVFPVELSRPRDVYESYSVPGFGEIYDRIWACFRSEVERGEAGGPVAATARPGAAE
jgi:NitT/TauT family transport system ATP-binding protein